MSATVPAGPKISYNTRLGLNWTIASALPESGLYISEPKTPCSRETVSAPTATTTTMTMGTHMRLTSPINAPLPDIALPAGRFDVRPSRRVHSGTLRQRLLGRSQLFSLLHSHQTSG